MEIDDQDNLKKEFEAFAPLLCVSAFNDDIKQFEKCFLRDHFGTFNQTTRSGFTPLMIASILGKQKLVEFIFSFPNKHCGRNLKNSDGNTALILAAKHVSIQICTRLLEDSKVDPKIANLSGKTALHYALASLNYDLIVVFAKHQAIEFNKPGKDNAFEILHRLPSQSPEEAARKEELILQLYVSPGAMTVVTSEKDYFEAARNGDMQTIKFFLDHMNEDINSADFNGNSALMLAIIYNKYECVEYLLKHKKSFDPNQ